MVAVREQTITRKGLTRDAAQPSLGHQERHISLQFSIAQRTAGLSLRQRPGSLPVSPDGWTPSGEDRLWVHTPAYVMGEHMVGYTIFAPASVDNAALYFDAKDPFGQSEYPPSLKSNINALLERCRSEKARLQEPGTDHGRSSVLAQAVHEACHREIKDIVATHAENQARGKILVVLRGQCHDCEKVQHAQSRGCVGLIIIRWEFPILVFLLPPWLPLIRPSNLPSLSSLDSV